MVINGYIYIYIIIRITISNHPVVFVNLPHLLMKTHFAISGQCLHQQILMALCLFGYKGGVFFPLFQTHL